MTNMQSTSTVFN